MKQGKKPSDPEAVLGKLLYNKTLLCIDWARGAKKYTGGDNFAQRVGDLASSIWDSIFVVRPEKRDKALFERVLREQLESLDLSGFEESFEVYFIEELVNDIMKGFNEIEKVIFPPL